MIEQAHQQHPDLTVEHWCDLFSVSRSWYYERGGQPESAAEESALRDEIERIILEFSGYGYRRVTHALNLRQAMPDLRTDEELVSSDQQNPAVFWLAIRPNQQKPRKFTDVKRIARNEQLGLTSVSVAVHLQWPD